LAHVTQGGIARSSLRKVRDYFASFINDDLGREYADKILQHGSRRWVRMGFLTEEESQQILKDDKMASIAYNCGVHLATGVLTPSGIGSIVAMICRSSYTLAKRLQAKRRNDYAMARIHNPFVMLLALIPVVGNFSYPLVHLGGRSKSLGIFLDECLGSPVVKRFSRVHILRHIERPYYSIIKDWFNDEPLFGTVYRAVSRRIKSMRKSQ